MDVQQLHVMGQTDSVYEILYSVDGVRDYEVGKLSHIVFAHCFETDDIQERYLEAIQVFEIN